MPVKTISLDGRWKLIDSNHKTGTRSRLHKPRTDTSKWLTTEVPGDIHPTLQKAGRIPDPFVGQNQDECTWTGSRDWWHRRDFNIPKSFKGDRIELIFDGIDTYGTVYFNGVKVGETSNMFLQYRFDVTAHARPGRMNTVVVCVAGVLPVIQQYDVSKYFACFNEKRIFARKCQCQFGWDWAPSLPGHGIWDSVRLEAVTEGIIEYVHVRTRTNGELFVSIRVDEATQMHVLDLERNRGPKEPKRKHKLVFRVKDGKKVIREEVDVTGALMFMNVHVPNPKLWWPNGYGPQHLYKYSVTLLEGKKVLDEETGRFGIREVELVENPVGRDSRTFKFRVNGRDIFCMGANWVPTDSFPGTVTRRKYEHLLQLAHEMHFNMFRLWGGGIYEKDVFYDLCDEHGIMIWQDLMFACADIPDDNAEWTMSVIPELEYQVRRLRSHPCVVYWCGGNEKTGSYGVMKGYGSIMTDIIAAGIVRNLAPDTPYRSSSPFSHVTIGNDPKSGDAHTGCWEDTFAGGDMSKFREVMNEGIVMFQSELGFGGPCMMRSIRKFIPEDKLWPLNEVWQEHIRDNPYNSLDETYGDVQRIGAETIFGKPASAAEYVKFASAFHAELEREEFEHHRRRQPLTSGALIWMYTDIWPCMTFALVDYYGLQKPVYYHLKRACGPVLVSLKKVSNAFEVYVTTNLPKPLAGTIRVEQQSVDGTLKRRLKTCKVKVAPDGSTLAASIPAKKLVADKNSYIYVSLQHNGGEIAVTYFPNLWRKVEWPDPGLKMRVRKTVDRNSEHQAVVTLTTGKYARFVNLATDEDIRAYFSDNFFDMPPGATKRITISSPEPFDPKMLKLNHWLTTWD